MNIINLQWFYQPFLSIISEINGNYIVDGDGYYVMDYNLGDDGTSTAEISLFR